MHTSFRVLYKFATVCSALFSDPNAFSATYFKEQTAAPCIAAERAFDCAIYYPGKWQELISPIPLILLNVPAGEDILQERDIWPLPQFQAHLPGPYFKDNFLYKLCLSMNFYEADSPSFESRIAIIFLCLFHLNILTKFLCRSKYEPLLVLNFKIGLW